MAASRDERPHVFTYAELAAEAKAERGEDRVERSRRVSPTMAYLLWIFLGWIGVHRLYLDRVPSALAMMVIAAAGLGLGVSGEGYWLTIPLGVWVLFDGTQIPKWVAEMNDGKR